MLLGVSPPGNVRRLRSRPKVTPSDDIKAGHRPQASTHSLTQALKLKRRRPPPRLNTPSTATPSWTEPLPRRIVVLSLYSLNFEFYHQINSVESHCKLWDLSKNSCAEGWVTLILGVDTAAHFINVQPDLTPLPCLCVPCPFLCLHPETARPRELHVPRFLICGV